MFVSICCVFVQIAKQIVNASGYEHIDGLVQDCSNSIVNTLEFL